MKKVVGMNVHGIEVRSADDGTVGIKGYAAVFDQVENGEVIRPGAFTRSLQHGGDIKLLLGHEGLPLASTRAGTMTVGEDDHGLWVDVESLDVSNPRAAELASILKRGDASEMSFGFIPVQQTKNADGVREILEARVLECSIVCWAWYPGTEVGLRIDPLLAQIRAGEVPERVRYEMVSALMGRATEGSFDQISQSVCDAICDRIEELSGMEPWVWIADLGPDWAVYQISGDDDYWLTNYTLDAATGVVTLSDVAPVEVSRVTTWVPVAVEMEQMSAQFQRLEIAKALLA